MAMSTMLAFGEFMPMWSNKNLPGYYNPPANTFFTQVPITVEPELMGFVMGKQGAVFKAITHQCRLHYIWFAKERGMVEIWGPEWGLQEAVKRLTERMDLIKNQRIIADNVLHYDEAFPTLK